MFRPYKAIFKQHFYKESNALRTDEISFFQWHIYMTATVV
jgi:hypothetical protein